MNNTFDIKRFRKYFVYDLINAKNNCGLTLLLLGAMPVFLFFFYELFSLIGAGRFTPVGLGAKIPSLVTAFTIAALYFPAKHYGLITDKKAGSSWVLLPASKLEKWVSILLMTCVVVPVVLVAEVAVWEGLLGLIFKDTYGAMTISGIAGGLNPVWDEFKIGNDVSVFMSWPLAMYLGWCLTILVFTLGSVCFKRGKIGKTFLALFLLSLAISIVIAAAVRIFGGANFEMNIDLNMSDEAIVRWVRAFQYIMYVIEFGLVSFFIYHRIKTIKH